MTPSKFFLILAFSLATELSLAQSEKVEPAEATEEVEYDTPEPDVIAIEGPTLTINATSGKWFDPTLFHYVLVKRRQNGSGVVTYPFKCSVSKQGGVYIEYEGVASLKETRSGRSPAEFVGNFSWEDFTYKPSESFEKRREAFQKLIEHHLELEKFATPKKMEPFSVSIPLSSYGIETVIPSLRPGFGIDEKGRPFLVLQRSDMNNVLKISQEEIPLLLYLQSDLSTVLDRYFKDVKTFHKNGEMMIEAAAQKSTAK